MRRQPRIVPARPTGGSYGTAGLDPVALESLHPTARIARVAERQHGVIARAQLAALGLRRGAIERRIGSGALLRLHRGVYAVGHAAIGEEGRTMAAVLAAGPSAAASHQSAASLLGLVDRPQTVAHVVTMGRSRSRPGVVVHRTARLPASHVVLVHAIPCTSVARTIVDAGAGAHAREIERLIDAASARGILDEHALKAIAEHPIHGRRAGTLRRLLAAHVPGSTAAANVLEERFLAICDEAGVPRAELNVPMRLPDGTRIVVDALWRRQRLAVEVDGWGTHGRRWAFERDRRRDVGLTVAGFRPARFTRDQVMREPAYVKRAIRVLVTAATPPADAGRERDRSRSSSGEGGIRTHEAG
jgi:hypothetical protein